MRCFVVIGAALLAGCGPGSPGSGLSVESVADLPPGDASGRALSGTWTFAIEIADSWCREGFLFFTPRHARRGALLQDRGRLTVTLDKPLLEVGRLEGGVNTDGTFDIGGGDTEGYLSALRMRGVFDGTGCSGALDFRTYHGPDDPLDCGGSALVTCQRVP
jgi:hypothetical protein